MVELYSGIGFAIVIGVVVLCGIGGILYWVFLKGQYKHRFRLYSADMKNSRLIKGKIKTDKSNKKYKYFSFQENGSVLEIQEPSFWEDGKPVRYITYDDNGEFIYIKKASLDKSELKHTLKPTHKTVFLQMLKDNQVKYPLLDKTIMATWGAIIIVALLIVVGFIYTFASNIKQAEQLIELAKVNGEFSKEMSEASGAMVTSSNSIYSAVSLLYNGTINRPLAAAGGTS